MVDEKAVRGYLPRFSLLTTTTTTSNNRFVFSTTIESLPSIRLWSPSSTSHEAQDITVITILRFKSSTQFETRRCIPNPWNAILYRLLEEIDPKEAGERQVRPSLLIFPAPKDILVTYRAQLRLPIPSSRYKAFVHRYGTSLPSALDCYKSLSRSLLAFFGRRSSRTQDISNSSYKTRQRAEREYSSVFS